MNISSIGSGTKPYASQASQNSDTLGELQRQKETLTKQLEAVKARPKNSQAEKNAADKQKKELEEKIASIDQKIQKASQNKSGEASAASKNPETAQATKNFALQKNTLLQKDDLTENSDQKFFRKNKSSFKNTGNIIDVYV